MRTARVTFIHGALAASLAVLLFARHTPSFWAQWAGAMALGFGLAWTTVHIHSVALKLVVAAVALGEVAVLSWLLQLGGIAWPPFTALAAGTLATGCGLLFALGKSGRRRRLLEEALGGRISQAAFQKMLDADAPPPFAGEKREASVVECAIANCRELAATLSAPDFLALCNAFAEIASQALLEAGGVLSKGGAMQMRAAFGAVLPDSTHSAQAREAARALEERLQAFRQTSLERWGVEADCRIAVHTGVMFVGIFGGAFDVVPAGESAIFSV